MVVVDDATAERTSDHHLPRAAPLPSPRPPIQRRETTVPIAVSNPRRRLRTTLVATALATAAAVGLGFSAVGAAHAEEMVHVKITVTANSTPADQTPTVSYLVNGNTTCDVNAGATPTFELDVPKDSSIRLAGMRGCYNVGGQIVEIAIGNGGDFTVSV
jgi:hypothetical protein